MLSFAPSSSVRDSVPTSFDTVFVSVTALRAYVSLVLRQAISPHAPRLVCGFFQASCDSLHIFNETDLRQPQALSIVIRYMRTVRHLTRAHEFLAWACLGQAISLTSTLRLHNENSYIGLEPEEAELRRRCFWQLFTRKFRLAISKASPSQCVANKRTSRLASLQRTLTYSQGGFRIAMPIKNHPFRPSLRIILSLLDWSLPATMVGRKRGTPRY